MPKRFNITLIFILLFISYSSISVFAISSSDVIVKANHKGCSEPLLDIISITGGRGVHAVLLNCGHEDLSNVTWKIFISGGFFGLIHKIAKGSIPILHPNQEVNISSGAFFGIGTIYVSITTNYNEVYTTGDQKFFITIVGDSPPP